MSKPYFLDTNILVYSFSSHEPEKQARAQELISDALVHRKGVISYQVVQEFLNVALKRFPTPLTVNEARNYYLKVLKPLCAIDSSPLLTLRALTVQEETQFQWYDSLVIASSLESGCRVLYSEDLQDGRVVDSVEIQNPFLG